MVSYHTDLGGEYNSDEFFLRVPPGYNHRKHSRMKVKMVGSSRIGPNSDDDFAKDFYHGLVEGQTPKFLFLFDNTLCAKN